MIQIHIATAEFVFCMLYALFFFLIGMVLMFTWIVRSETNGFWRFVLFNFSMISLCMNFAHAGLMIPYIDPVQKNVPIGINGFPSIVLINAILFYFLCREMIEEYYRRKNARLSGA